MAGQVAPTVFLSHSHHDKAVARCLVRRLTVHGIKVWIDERELRLGATLTSSIRAQIEEADVLLVLASQNATVSKWVGLELEFAQQHRKTIIPLFIDSVTDRERFQPYLGVDATSPQIFADAVHSLIRDLYRSVDLDLPPIDRAALEDGLRELAREEPDLAPLIIGCLESEGLHMESEDGVFNANFYALDDALNALFDLMPNDSIVYALAHGFYSAGAGARALSSWVAATGDGGLQLVSAVGKRLEIALISTALKLLGSCNPPNNQALYGFIENNAGQFDRAQRRSVLRLVTWPVRDTSGQADVLGWVAYKHFPDSPEICEMWRRWIREGAFDGEPKAPHNLSWYLVQAHREGLPGWKPINEELRSHVRGYLRSGDKNKVVVAVDHIQAAADAGAPVLAVLLSEAGATGSAEWVEWAKRDRDTAEWMRSYVSNVVAEARGGRDWLKAWQDAEQTVEFEKQRRKILAPDKQEPSGRS